MVEVEEHYYEELCKTEAKYKALRAEYRAYKEYVRQFCGQQEHVLQRILFLQSNDALQRVQALKDWAYKKPEVKTQMAWSSK